MIVCHCNVVSCSDIGRALETGARTVSEVCRATGAAQKCGGCVFSVRQVVCKHVAEGIPPREEAVRAAS